MAVSGVVIRCGSGDVEATAREIAVPDKVEVHGILPGKMIVAVLEAEDVAGEMRLVESILARKDVIDLRVAYHHFGDPASGPERLKGGGA